MADDTTPVDTLLSASRKVRQQAQQKALLQTTGHLSPTIPTDMTDPRDRLVADAGDVKQATANPTFSEQAAALAQPTPPPDDHLSPSDEPTNPGSAHKVFE